MIHALASHRAPLNGSTAARPVRALEAVGDDGLTDAERDAGARRYAAQATAIPSEKGKAALRDWYLRARAR